jgi:hypothetical protein
MSFFLIPKVTRVAAFLAISVSSPAQHPEEYCAFEVVVKLPTGVPVAQVPVSGLDERGEIFGSADTDTNGVARICDSPSGLVSIRVGGSRCGAVTVNYLTAVWLRTRSVHVTYKYCGGEDHVPPSRCTLTLRVHRSDGTALTGVQLVDASSSPAKLAQKDVSDRYGRIFRTIEFGRSLTGMLVKDRFVSRAIVEQCKPGEPYRHERIIELEER